MSSENKKVNNAPKAATILLFAAIVIAGPLVLFAIGAWASGSAAGLGSLAVLVLAAVIFAPEIARFMQMAAWKDSLPRYDFIRIWNGTGIAVDTINRTVHLAQTRNGNFVGKAYPALDLLEWNYLGQDSQGSASLLIIQVRDSEHPVWKVSFENDADPDFEGRRWLERLQKATFDKAA